MKISDVRVLRANSFLYVEIETDTGLVGTGESGAWGFLDASAQVLESFKTYLMGQDPLHIEHHFQYMYRCFHFRGAAIMGAISAVDIALWDIAGQHYGVPIYMLLGGKCRNKVRTYYHVNGATDEELFASCLAGKEAGYTAIGHLSPFLDEPRNQPVTGSYSQMMSQAIERVWKIRELVGNEVDLCIEMHRRLSPFEAITFAKGVEGTHPLFLEDPTIPDNFDSMGYIASQCGVPIATGERIHTPQEFTMLFQRNAMAYARTSVCLCGGITGTRKIANIAESYGIKIVPHNPYSPVSSAACIQVCAALSNVAVMELPDHEGMSATERYTSASTVNFKSFSQKDMVTWTPTVVNGYVQLPETPGLGVGLVPQVAEKFPAKRRDIISRLHEDGSVVDH